MKKCVDLTHGITSGMPVFPGDPMVEITTHLNYREDGCRVSRWVLGSHTGTHMDAPSHFIPGASSLDMYDVNRFFRRGVVVDVSHLAPDAAIEPGHLEASLKIACPGDFLVLYTGWDRYWGHPLYDRHPHLSLAGASLLVASGISLVGIDAPDIEKAPGGDYPVHHCLLHHDCLIVENLTNLRQISETVGLFTFLPLSVEAADGSPVRAIYMPVTGA